MNSLSLTPFSSACNSSTLPKLKPLYTLHHHSYINVSQKQRIRNGRCRAELSHEAPFVVAIGACVLNSLVFPLPVGPNDNEDGDSVIDSADARFAVMGIISFIPYFNWMSWVFAWMDTGDKRYTLYALVYLAPYLSPGAQVDCHIHSNQTKPTTEIDSCCWSRLGDSQEVAILHYGAFCTVNVTVRMQTTNESMVELITVTR